jgi:hypothetical protein
MKPPTEATPRASYHMGGLGTPDTGYLFPRLSDSFFPPFTQKRSLVC